MDSILAAPANTAPVKLTPAVDIRDVFRIYRERQVETVALRGVSLLIQPGERVMIVGPSGSGKSTLLNLIGGLDTPDAGQIYVGGQGISQMPETARSRLRRQHIGFVFQDANLIPFLSALENVALPMHIAGVPHARGRAAELLSEVGLAARLHHLPAALSGGEQQRAGIACALANQPALLLADELTGELDSQTAHGIMQLLVRLNETLHTTMIVVTHDMTLAAYMQHIVEMRDGQIVRFGAHHD